MASRIASSPARAESSTTGTEASNASVRTACKSPKPSRFGIMTSDKIKNRNRLPRCQQGLVSIRNGHHIEAVRQESPKIVTHVSIVVGDDDPLPLKVALSVAMMVPN